MTAHDGYRLEQKQTHVFYIFTDIGHKTMFNLTFFKVEAPLAVE